MAILKTMAVSLLAAAVIHLAMAQAKGSATTTLDTAADARLTKPISVDEPVITLGELVQKINQQSKVKISVSKPLADSRICIVASGQPLGATLEKIAATFGYTWEVSGEKEARSYHLTQTNQARLQQQQEIKKTRDLSIELLREALQTIEGALQKGDYESFRKQMEEMPPLPETTKDPKEAREILRRHALNYINHWEAWIAAGTLLRLSPPDWNRLQQGYPLVFSSAAPNTPVPNNALAFWKKETMRQHEQTREIMSKNSAITIPSPGGNERPMSMDDILRQQEERTLGVKELRVHLRYDTETGQARYQLEVPSEGNERRETIAIAVSSDMRGGPRLMSTRNLLNPADWQLAEKQREIMGKKEVKLPESLAGAKVEPDKRAKEDYLNQYAYELAAKARASKTSVVMEWYPLYPPAESTMMFIRMPGSGEPDVLSENGYEVVNEDGWTMIQHTARAFSRRDDVAQANVKRWLYDTEGKPNLDMVAEMAFLTSPQLAGLLSHAGRSSMPNISTSGGGDVRIVAIPGMGLGALRKLIEDPGLKQAMRLYGQLSPLQKQKIAQGETLPYSTLSVAQQKTYLETVALITRAPFETVQALLRDGNTAMDAGFSLNNAAGISREVSRFSLGEGDNPISFELNMDVITFNLRWRGEELKTDPLTLPKPEAKDKRST